MQIKISNDSTNTQLSEAAMESTGMYWIPVWRILQGQVLCVFVINLTNMKRVNTWGINQATKHVLMAALCYNLKKYLKFEGRKAQITVQFPSNHKKEPFQAHLEAMRGFWSNVILHVIRTNPKFTWAGMAFI